MDAPQEPCPSCGHPVHPVAGRCKHCKVDLVALRAEAARAARLAAVRQQAAASPIKPARLPDVPREGGRRRWSLVALALLVLAGGIGVGFAAERLMRTSAATTAASPTTS